MLIAPTDRAYTAGWLAGAATQVDVLMSMSPTTNVVIGNACYYVPSLLLFDDFLAYIKLTNSRSS